MTCIPQPPVYLASNGDAYVRLPDVLKLYMSFGLTPSTVRNINETGPVGSDKVCENFWKCEQAKKRLQSLLHRSSNTLKAGIVTWSDGCDANSGKSNRGSVHVCTVTLFAGENNNSRYTFLIHIGREDVDHREVTKVLLQDLATLEIPTSFYNGTEFLDYQFVYMASIHDRPEKSKLCGFGGHNGLLTMRYPVSCLVPDNLASCDLCLHRRTRSKTGWRAITDVINVVTGTSP